MSSHRFVCAHCGQEKTHVNPNGCGGTGYATYRMDGIEKKVCYACCAKEILAYMRDTGRAVLYLTNGPEGPGPARTLRSFGNIENLRFCM